MTIEPPRGPYAGQRRSNTKADWNFSPQIDAGERRFFNGGSLASATARMTARPNGGAEASTAPIPIIGKNQPGWNAVKKSFCQIHLA
ncbi:hypothetical protein P4C99_20420, partial [Pontiellaceae bacterium B1224]|nr:hypothetical protein [Pontiellaceae bacterium B1224]